MPLSICPSEVLRNSKLGCSLSEVEVEVAFPTATGLCEDVGELQLKLKLELALERLDPVVPAVLIVFPAASGLRRSASISAESGPHTNRDLIKEFAGCFSFSRSRSFLSEGKSFNFDPENQ